jgi:hypothetical protein
MNTADVPQMSMVVSKATTACERCAVIPPLMPDHQRTVDAPAEITGELL